MSDPVKQYDQRLLMGDGEWLHFPACQNWRESWVFRPHDTHREDVWEYGIRGTLCTICILNGALGGETDWVEHRMDWNKRATYPKCIPVEEMLRRSIVTYRLERE